MSIATDDFIRSSGNLAYVNTWLKLFALLLLLVCLLLGAAVSVKIVDDRTEHVVPIVINQAMGDAIPVDDRVVDATGEERSPVEARRFCEDFLTEALIGGLFISADGGRCLVPDLWLLQAEILDGARLLLLGYSCCTIEVAGQLLEPIFEDASIGKLGAIHAAPERPAPHGCLWVTSVTVMTPAEAPLEAFERECSNA